MRNTTKKFLGLVGLALVVFLTIVAYLMPTEGAYADEFAGRDTLRITVIGQDEYASVVIDSPTTEEPSTSPEVPVTFTYQNASRVNFTLKYYDEDGNPVEAPLESYVPEGIDPEHSYASGTATITPNLRSFGYGIYVLAANAESPIGDSTGDSIEIEYVPAILEQTGAEEGTNDPIVDVTHDEGIKKLEIMPVDENGNPLLDEPFVINITPDADGNYPSGVVTATLPFTSNGLTTGEYTLRVTAYNSDDEELYSPRDTYPAEYVQPLAPDVPNTGAFEGGLNIAKSDYIITSLLVFGIASIAALRLAHRKKTNYRKHTR
ncbi:hypothetical protein IKG06_04160 [Candidatus Saccharibacteria bacterium]|nr:hypothetical protein [Candidatus Saccharibacteria bacterium]